jgi:membrane protease YdiL (CAAX protease family)
MKFSIKHLVLLFLTLGVLTSIGMGYKIVGLCLFLISMYFIHKEDVRFRIHMYVILIPFIILNLIHINTDISTNNFLIMGLACLLAVSIPYIVLKKYGEPLQAKWFSKKQWSFEAVGYLILAFTIAYFTLPWYFNTFPTVPAMWPQPELFSIDSFMRLFIGTNALGIWDELFFINCVFVILLRFFSFRTALIAQAVMFTSFLFELGFIEIGPFLIGTFAILQGLAFRKTESLSYVIMLHLIIDAVLFMTIINYYYPGSFLLFG